MQTVFVTGGAGFIGSHLCERLVQRGDRVVCYDNFDSYYDPAIKERNIAHIAKNPRFCLVREDILNAERLARTLSDNHITAVVHLAARAGVRASLAEPALYQHVNVCGTTHLLEAARRAGLRSVVLASSSSVYGACPNKPFSENETDLKPMSPYAASKLAMEQIAFAYHRIYGMDTVCLRFFTVYGPRQRPDMAIFQFVKRIKLGQPIDMYGDGSSQRDYTYISDIVSGIVCAIDMVPGLGCQAINLGSSEPVTLREMIEAIGLALDTVPCCRVLPEQLGDVQATLANVQKAQRLLGYNPTTSIRQGVSQYVSWLKNEEEVDRGVVRTKLAAA